MSELQCVWVGIGIKTVVLQSLFFFSFSSAFFFLVSLLVDLIIHSMHLCIKLESEIII